MEPAATDTSAPATSPTRDLARTLPREQITRRFAKTLARLKRAVPILNASRLNVPLRQISNRAETCEAVQEGIRDAMAEMESRFSDIGDQLEKMTRESDELVRDAERLLVLASGQSEGQALFETTLALLRQPLDFLEACAEELQTLAGDLGGSRGLVTPILGLQAQLQATIAPLGYIQILYKVESAHLPTDLQQMFIGVAADIKRLEIGVGKMFAEKFESLTDIDRTLAHLDQRLATTIDHHKRVVSEKRRQIARTLEDLREELGRNAQRDLTLSASTRAIADQIGQVVVGLQYQDIVKQKSDHLISGMTHCQLADEALATRGEAAKRGALRSISENTQVQSAHLSSVRRDLEGASTTIGSGVEAIISRVVELDEGCVALSELNKVTVAPDGMIQILLDALTDVKSWIGETCANADRIREELVPIAEAARVLSNSMTDLPVTMHLIALNAQIQAILLGTGTGLENLASQTVEVSTETSRLSKDMLAQLHLLATSLTGVADACTRLGATGETQRTLMAGDGTQIESELHALRDRCLQALNAVASRTESIREAANQVHSLSQTPDLVEQRCEAARHHLEEVQALAAEFAGDAEENESRSKPAWWNRYTMQSERDLHAAVISGREAVRQRPEDHAADHTELFVAPTETQPQHSTPTTATSAETSKPADADPLKADNIDLF